MSLLNEKSHKFGIGLKLKKIENPFISSPINLSYHFLNKQNSLYKSGYLFMRLTVRQEKEMNKCKFDVNDPCLTVFGV